MVSKFCCIQYVYEKSTLSGVARPQSMGAAKGGKCLIQEATIFCEFKNLLLSLKWGDHCWVNCRGH